MMDDKFTADFKPESHRFRARELGLVIGGLQPGEHNAITDVPGVRVGHTTLLRGSNVRTGVTAILPHSGYLYQAKVPAAIQRYNGFGKLAGYSQVAELGNLETPIILTNTLSVGTAVTAVVKYTLNQPENVTVTSVNPVVGETNDGFLNDIRGLHVTEADVLAAITSATDGAVAEGCVGAGTGTRAFGLKGGIGTASRTVTHPSGGAYVVGVLVQANFGRNLILNGVPFAKEITGAPQKTMAPARDPGSCMIVIATDAPLSVRNLKRLAKRSFNGMARTCNFMSNGSGDYAIAFSTAYRIPDYTATGFIEITRLLANSEMDPLFLAVEEATQAAIYNALFMATSMEGYLGRKLEAISMPAVFSICKKYAWLTAE
ncbi:P1 family peptidase [candidate division KSB1 bacterium]|nr:P1 family peptidase [candidate division KSB1 bacterium]